MRSQRIAKPSIIGKAMQELRGGDNVAVEIDAAKDTLLFRKATPADVQPPKPCHRYGFAKV